MGGAGNNVLPAELADEVGGVDSTISSAVEGQYLFIGSLTGDGRPILVGTGLVEASEVLSSKLKAIKLPHEVLNAKNHDREALIVAQLRNVTLRVESLDQITAQTATDRRSRLSATRSSRAARPCAAAVAER